MTTATNSRLTTRLASLLMALVMTVTINGGMLLVFHEASQGDQAEVAVLVDNTSTAAPARS